MPCVYTENDRSAISTLQMLWTYSTARYHKINNDAAIIKYNFNVIHNVVTWYCISHLYFTVHSEKNTISLNIVAVLQ